MLIKREPEIDPAICEVQIQVGKFWAKINPENAKALIRYRWRPKRKKKKIYAVRRFKRLGKTYEISMHNSIMKPPKGYDVHHKNHDTLDNRKTNLENVPHDRHPHS